MTSAEAARTAVEAAPHYFHWGVVQISLANLLVVVAMIVVFVLALLLPFPRSHADRADEERRDDRR